MGDSSSVDQSSTAILRGGWTFIPLCAGLALIAMVVIVPAADSNRRLVYQRDKLRLDLEQIQKQIVVNRDFLQRVETDPELTLRLIQRELHAVPKGMDVINVPLTNGSSSGASGSADAGLAQGADHMSPYEIVKVPAPPALAPYKPSSGILSTLALDTSRQVLVMGVALLLVAMGLILGDDKSAAERKFGDA